MVRAVLNGRKPGALVFFGSAHRNLSCWRTRRASWKIDGCTCRPDPSPAPWRFAERLYGVSHCLVDLDGRVIGCNFPMGKGPLLEQAPAMAALLRELVAGASPEQLRKRAAQILGRIDIVRHRAPGEDNE